MLDKTVYSIRLHQHRFAAWCAARAISRGYAMSNLALIEVTEKAALADFVGAPSLLPPPEKMDDWHTVRRQLIIEAARELGRELTHGVAAKICNVYFKAVYHNAAYCDHPSVVALHPPIDSNTIKSVKQLGPGDDKLWRNAKWTKLTSGQYEALIADLRRRLGNKPLWHAEQLWTGLPG